MKQGEADHGREAEKRRYEARKRRQKKRKKNKEKQWWILKNFAYP